MGKKHKGAVSRSAELPSKEQILEFIQSSHGKVGKREIARAFHIKGGERIALKRILKEMSNEGLIEGNRKVMRRPGTISKVAMIDIVGRDDNGDFFGRPNKWDETNEGPAPKVLIGEGRNKRGQTPGIGDRVLAHIDKIEIDEVGYSYIAIPIKVLPKNERRLLGIYRQYKDGGEIQPIDKKSLKSWSVKDGDKNGAEHGELVSFEIMSRGRFNPARARITERLGNPKDQGLISLIAIETHGIPHHFPKSVTDELEYLPDLTADGREDMRHVPLITIDPADARDHDDAVWATADDASDNEGGWIVVVAIADVAKYIRPNTGLDKEAQKRGNSVYFPDRVVPMLPEKISNDLCSLRELEDRPALAVEMIFDKNGKKRGHSFKRILMKSAAKLSYNQAQAAIDGKVDEKTEPLLEPVLKPLWAAYSALKTARQNRAPLALDLPERKILMNDKGEIEDIITPDRLDAHKLVEEFMIQANVAAAETLERKNSPLIYRVHDEPSDEKLKAFKNFLATLNISFGGDGPMKPASFNGILRQAEGKDHQVMVTEVVLRSQAQAEYNPQNYGHFGLNLSRYAHFTSPIRRYADLIVHRALIGALGLGDDGLPKDAAENLESIASHISGTERRAMVAERETVDRLVALYLEAREGAEFKGRISGVTRSGLFVKLDETGADGFIPISTLGGDYYIHDEVTHSLIGERTHITFHIGQRVDVKLIEIIASAGAMRFEMLSEGIRGKKKPPLRAKSGSHKDKHKKDGRRGSLRRSGRSGSKVGGVSGSKSKHRASKK